MTRKLIVLTASVVLSALSLIARPHWPNVDPAGQESARQHPQSTAVATVAEFDRAVALAVAGDSIILKSKTWTDAWLVFKANGNAKAPIVLCAEVPGKTILKGNSRLQIQGNYLHVSGLVFDSIHTLMANDEALVEVSKFKLADGEEFNHHIRFSECEFTNLHMRMAGKTNFSTVRVMGRFHRVDHCKFDGSLSTDNGRILDVVIEGREVANGSGYDVQVLLDHNYFLNHKPQGGNGYEGLRFRCRDTRTTERASNSVAEYNLFVKADKEAEAISNKSDGNTYRFNTFIDQAEGDLSIRGGTKTVVEYNVFIKEDGVKGVGILRFQHSDHVARGNYFYNLVPRVGGGVVEFACGTDIPGAVNPINTHPKNVVITDNIIIGRKGYGIHFAGSYQKVPGRVMLPEGLVLSNNWIDLDSTTAKDVLGVDEKVPTELSDAMTAGFKSMNNSYSSRSRFGTAGLKGWMKAETIEKPQVINGLEAPATRVNNGWVDVMKKLKRLTPHDVGPSWTH